MPTAVLAFFLSQSEFARLEVFTEEPGRSYLVQVDGSEGQHCDVDSEAPCELSPPPGRLTLHVWGTKAALDETILLPPTGGRLRLSAASDDPFWAGIVLTGLGLVAFSPFAVQEVTYSHGLGGPPPGLILAFGAAVASPFLISGLVLIVLRLTEPSIESKLLPLRF